MDLVSGVYAYVGSAFGPGGLDGRLGRHWGGGGSVHWHVDYLRRRSSPEGAWITRDPTPREHDWAAALASTPGASIPVHGFGASDCDCPAHLFRFREPPALERFRERAEAEAAGEPDPVRRWTPAGG
ncbi:MAG: DUF123 domain-containing protein [Gemmatimonadota bacterium]